MAKFGPFLVAKGGPFYMAKIGILYLTIYKYSNGSAIKNIPPFSILKKQNIAVPPLEEQAAIVAELDYKTALIDATIAEKESQLLTMQNHMAAVIFEYVTGKKRVKEVR